MMSTNKQDEAMAASVLVGLTKRAAEAPAAAATKKKKQRKEPEPDFPVQPKTLQVVHAPRGTMNHTYRDMSVVPAKEGEALLPGKIEDMSFSQKVHYILSQDEYSKWIGWLPHGRAFKVFVPVFFERNICEKFFGHKRYSSFLRQLNNHGFKHVTKGEDRNAYYHEVCCG